MRRLSLNRSEPAKKSGQNITKNRYRTTVAEPIAGNASGTALYRVTRSVCLRRNQAARSGPAERPQCPVIVFDMSAFAIVHRRGPEPVLVRHRERRNSARQCKIYDADFRFSGDCRPCSARSTSVLSYVPFITSATKSALARQDTAGSVTRERDGQFKPSGALYESFVNGGRITAKVFSQRLPNLWQQPALARPNIDSRMPRRCAQLSGGIRAYRAMGSVQLGMCRFASQG